MADDLVRLELLCFIQRKSRMLPCDNIVTVCVDFYTADEVKAAVTVLYEFIDQRPPAYKAPDKEWKSVADMVKVVLNPNVTIPTFVAADISRLPPVGLDHLDMSAMMRELSALRSEVRAITSIRMEMEQMRTTIRELQESRQVS